MKRVLIDASSAILLHKARLFQEMANHYCVTMVPTVFSEITVAHHSGAAVFREARKRGTIRVAATEPRSDRPAISSSLHAGERATIMAYREEGAHFIIMDDGRGARACREMDIPYINALLCPGILHLSGKIDGACRRSTFEHLKKIGRYGDGIVAYAENVNEDALAFFLP